jgi:hypothetical protein
MEALEDREVPSTVTWNGPGGSTYTGASAATAANWSGGSLPTASDTIRFTDSTKWCDFTGWSGGYPAFTRIEDTAGTKIKLTELEFTDSGDMYCTDFEMPTTGGHLQFNGTGTYVIGGSGGLPPMVPSNKWTITDTDGTAGTTSWMMIGADAQLHIGGYAQCGVMIDNRGTTKVTTAADGAIATAAAFTMVFPSGSSPQDNQIFNWGVLQLDGGGDIYSDNTAKHNIINGDDSSLGQGRVEKTGGSFSLQMIGIDNEGGVIALEEGEWDIIGSVTGTGYTIESSSNGSGGNPGTILQYGGTVLHSSGDILVESGYYKIASNGTTVLDFISNSDFLYLKNSYLNVNSGVGAGNRTFSTDGEIKGENAVMTVTLDWNYGGSNTVTVDYISCYQFTIVASSTLTLVVTQVNRPTPKPVFASLMVLNQSGTTANPGITLSLGSDVSGTWVSGDLYLSSP